MNARTIIAAVFAALVLSLTAAIPEPSAGDLAPRHSMIDLDTLGGTTSRAVRINTIGQIIGESTTADGAVRAVLWTRGIPQDLGASEHRNSTAVDINERGQVIGFSFDEFFPDSPSRAFFWEDGVLTDLGTPGEGHNIPTDINEWGEVVGWWSADETGANPTAFLWDRGQLTPLGTLGGSGAIAHAINNRGQVVGESELDPAIGGHHAFLWHRGEMIDITPTTPPDPETEPLPLLSAATGINDRSQVIGWTFSVDCGCGSQAFFFEEGVRTRLTLGGASSFPFAINQRGQVVGSSETDEGETHAFLWHDGNIVDLGTLGGSFSSALAVNELGHVVGFSETAAGEFHAFFWARGVMIDLGAEMEPSTATDINLFGQIVGESNDRAALWKRHLRLQEILRRILHAHFHEVDFVGLR